MHLPSDCGSDDACTAEGARGLSRIHREGGGHSGDLGAISTIHRPVGRLAKVATIRGGLMSRLSRTLPGGTVEALTGIATVAKHAAQGAAILADGLAGGSAADVVQTLGIREATGTVLDHLYVITPEAARQRLGI
jgi:predicted butyrate kinase (DUF1464 family)